MKTDKGSPSAQQPLRILMAGGLLTCDSSLTDHLSSAGFSLTLVDNGARAAELCLQEKIHVAILSTNLSTRSGFQIAEAMQSGSSVGLVLSATDWSAENIENALRLGVSHCVLEPLSVASADLAIRTASYKVNERLEARERLRESNVAATLSRTTGIAIGVLMSKLQLNERMAYELIRRLARRQSRKVFDVASSIVSKSNDLNSLLIDLSTKDAGG